MFNSKYDAWQLGSEFQSVKLPTVASATLQTFLDPAPSCAHDAHDAHHHAGTVESCLLTSELEDQS
jgi:hypothetical protein